jgi:hypothetical protein
LTFICFASNKADRHFPFGFPLCANFSILTLTLSFNFDFAAGFGCPDTQRQQQEPSLVFMDSMAAVGMFILLTSLFLFFLVVFFHIPYDAG